MSFSLDLTKPLGRLGLAINTLVLGAVFYGISVGAYHYMTHTLPESGAHAKEAAVKAALVEKSVAKAKTAAKGKAFDEKAAVAAAEAAAEPEVKKKAEKIHHEAAETWAPFAIFLLILSRSSSLVSCPSTSSAAPTTAASRASGSSLITSVLGLLPATSPSILSLRFMACVTLGPPLLSAA